MKKSQNKFASLFTCSGLGLVDRDKEIKQLMYALYTREHMLLKGPAGTAKSAFAMNVFNSIGGAKTFNIHLTKQTTEEYVFGPLNIIELKKGNIVHNTKDSILEANFAFLDEFFDASDVLLRSLLGVLNERKWMKGQQQATAILNTAIVTSNYQRENEVTQAILDRIIFKSEIKPSTQKSKRLKIYENYLNNPDFIPKVVITLKELEEFLKIVDDPKSVTFSKDVLEAYDTLLSEYIKESKKYISPRTANKALKVIKISALLDNRNKVNFQDLKELIYVFCTINNEIEEQLFDTTYERCVGTMEEEREILNQIESVRLKINGIPTDFSYLTDIEFVEKMRELNEYTHFLEQLQCPTQKCILAKGSILNVVREVITNNKDKLFNKSNNLKSDRKQEIIDIKPLVNDEEKVEDENIVEGEEVIETVIGPKEEMPF